MDTRIGRMTQMTRIMHIRTERETRNQKRFK